MSHPSDTLSASRAHCHRVARAAGSSFYPCFALLSPTKRAAMEALYAFLRHTDDLADGPQPLDERRRSLGVWREAVIEAIGEGSGFGVDNRRVGQATAQSHQKPPEAAGGTALSLVPPYDPRYSVLGTQSSVPSAQSSVPSTQYSAPGTQYSVLGTQDSKPGRAGPEAADASPSESVHHSSFLIPHSPLLPALAAAVREFCIPPEHLLAVLDGVQMDLDGHRYETFDELALYCDRVASAVGLACIYIWGFRSPQALEPARQCGRAFQLTNILRDLKEDAAAGRIYLPADDFRQSGYSAEELQRRRDKPGLLSPCGDGDTPRSGPLPPRGRVDGLARSGRASDLRDDDEHLLSVVVQDRASPGSRPDRPHPPEPLAKWLLAARWFSCRRGGW